MSSELQTELLFAYGTLRLAEVQVATFGRRLEGEADALPQYHLAMITIADEEFVTKSGTAEHKNLQFTGTASDYVEGTVFKVTRKELEQADAYEPAGYERVQVQLKSGKSAWIYLDKSF
jgi:gamma-glutamylcyclotransferase (GGCT)/AIG2-like uncharacterized protein YtfP